jgi:hypothetical protein
MAINQYHFITQWFLEATCEEVSQILLDGPGLARWWPSVYLQVIELEHGDAMGLGTVLDLHTKGWLPYTLHWYARVTESHYPAGFSLEATQDFIGRGIWTIDQAGSYVKIIYDWKILAEKPLLKYFSFIMKPLFSANHHWAMRMGEESLKLELLRRRAKTDEERNRIPPPPKATFWK